MGNFEKTYNNILSMQQHHKNRNIQKPQNHIKTRSKSLSSIYNFDELQKEKIEDEVDDDDDVKDEYDEINYSLKFQRSSTLTKEPFKNTKIRRTKSTENRKLKYSSTSPIKLSLDIGFNLGKIRKKTKISTPKLTKKKVSEKKKKKKEKKEKKERKLKEKREKKEKKEKEKRQKREKLKREKKEKRKLKNRKISDSSKYDEAHN